jgi:hypothetical protein
MPIGLRHRSEIHRLRGTASQAGLTLAALTRR